MAKFILGYNIFARGREGLDNTWYIEDLETGERVLTNHIEIKVPLSTIERTVPGKGFGMVVEGVLEQREHPSVGKFIVIKAE